LLLSLKIKHLNDIKNENTKLRKALQLEEEKTINLLGAEVLTFSPSNWRHIVTINKGSNDDIKEGQFAIDENGHLLGKIIEINKTSSRLILIDDPEFTTSVFVANKDFGLLKGNRVGAKVLYIEDGSELKKGDKVWLKIPLINFPIEIGEIKKVKNNENSLFWDVDVKLYTKNSFFEKIFIIKIGIICISLFQKNTPPIILCVLFGYLKECFIPQAKSLSVIEFPIICLIIRYFKFRLFFASNQTHNFLIKSLIISLSLVIHILFNSLSLGLMIPVLYLQFFIQSLLIASILNFYFEKWLSEYSTIF